MDKKEQDSKNMALKELIEMRSRVSFASTIFNSNKVEIRSIQQSFKSIDCCIAEVALCQSIDDISNKIDELAREFLSLMKEMMNQERMAREN